MSKRDPRYDVFVDDRDDYRQKNPPVPPPKSGENRGKRLVRNDAKDSEPKPKNYPASSNQKSSKQQANESATLIEIDSPQSEVLASKSTKIQAASNNYRDSSRPKPTTGSVVGGDYNKSRSSQFSKKRETFAAEDVDAVNLKSKVKDEIKSKGNSPNNFSSKKIIQPTRYGIDLDAINPKQHQHSRQDDLTRKGSSRVKEEPESSRALEKLSRLEQIAAQDVPLLFHCQCGKTYPTKDRLFSHINLRNNPRRGPPEHAQIFPSERAADRGRQRHSLTNLTGQASHRTDRMPSSRTQRVMQPSQYPELGDINISSSGKGYGHQQGEWQAVTSAAPANNANNKNSGVSIASLIARLKDSHGRLMHYSTLHPSIPSSSSTPLPIDKFVTWKSFKPKLVFFQHFLGSLSCLSLNERFDEKGYINKIYPHSEGDHLKVYTEDCLDTYTYDAKRSNGPGTDQDLLDLFPNECFASMGLASHFYAQLQSTMDYIQREYDEPLILDIGLAVLDKSLGSTEVLVLFLISIFKTVSAQFFRELSVFCVLLDLEIIRSRQKVYDVHSIDWRYIRVDPECIPEMVEPFLKSAYRKMFLDEEIIKHPVEFRILTPDAVGFNRLIVTVKYMSDWIFHMGIISKTLEIDFSHAYPAGTPFVDSRRNKQSDSNKSSVQPNPKSQSIPRRSEILNELSSITSKIGMSSSTARLSSPQDTTSRSRPPIRSNMLTSGRAKPSSGIIPESNTLSVEP